MFITNSAREISFKAILVFLQKGLKQNGALKMILDLSQMPYFTSKAYKVNISFVLITKIGMDSF
jgi:hypothetical protein